MHPAQARGRQMNYNISFSRPYIPTDRAYWRGLIAFNSLLVHSCNEPSRAKGDTFSPLRSLFSLLLFFFHRSPQPTRSALFAPFLLLSPTSSFGSPRSIRRHLVVRIIIALFFSPRRRDRLTLMQPLIVRGGLEKFWVADRPAGRPTPPPLAPHT